jgi:membrane-bound lytic murein transglycosylase B
MPTPFRLTLAGAAGLMTAACATVPPSAPMPVPSPGAPQAHAMPERTPPGVTPAATDGSIANPTEAGFRAYVASVRARALSEGIPASVWEAATAGIRLNRKAIELSASAPEVLGQIWTYIGRRNTADKIALGRRALAENAALFDRVERDYGVPREVLASIWGNETGYGSVLGDFNLPEVLATLAYEGRRRSFFENEFVASLKLIAQKGVSPGSLRGSYAGAVGQVQFMPSNYLALGVDYDGDGAPDLRNSKADAFASAANYLIHYGWKTGEPWMAQVDLPAGFRYEMCDVELKKNVMEWAALGVTVGGASVSGRFDPGLQASIILPAGHRGAAVMVFDNYRRFLDYNPSQLYALAVGDLADALEGRRTLAGPWPTDMAPLRVANLREIQRLLQAMGYDIMADGRAGKMTRAAIRDWQLKAGLPADGFPSNELLARLRKANGS